MGDGPFAFEVSYSPNYFATHSSILEYRKKTSLILATKQAYYFVFWAGFSKLSIQIKLKDFNGWMGLNSRSKPQNLYSVYFL